MAFFASAIDTLKILVIALGAGQWLQGRYFYYKEDRARPVLH